MPVCGIQIAEGRRKDVRVLNGWLFGAKRTRALPLDELRAGRADYASRTIFLSDAPVVLNPVANAHLSRVSLANIR